MKNLLNIESKVKQKIQDKKLNIFPKIIAVSKTFKLNNIIPLIEHGHIHFGENKVQEALEKWTDIKKQNSISKIKGILKKRKRAPEDINIVSDLFQSINMSEKKRTREINFKSRKYFFKSCS